jgi:hypothetical protein
VLAFFVVRRSRPARIALVGSSVMVVLLSLLMILSGFSVVTLILGVVVTVLLFTGGAGEWFSRTPSTGGYQDPYAGYGGSYADPYQQQGPHYGEHQGQQPSQPYAQQQPQGYGQQGQEPPQAPADQGGEGGQGEQRPTYPPQDEEHKGPW